jgi:hypothetical protein
MCARSLEHQHGAAMPKDSPRDRRPENPVSRFVRDPQRCPVGKTAEPKEHNENGPDRGGTGQGQDTDRLPGHLPGCASRAEYTSKLGPLRDRAALFHFPPASDGVRFCLLPTDLSPEFGGSVGDLKITQLFPNGNRTEAERRLYEDAVSARERRREDHLFPDRPRERGPGSRTLPGRSCNAAGARTMSPRAPPSPRRGGSSAGTVALPTGEAHFAVVCRSSVRRRRHGGLERLEPDPVGGHAGLASPSRSASIMGPARR